MQTKTLKSKAKIFICLTLSFLIPAMVIFMNQFVSSTPISSTLIVNSVAFILVITNNRLLNLHLKRFRKNIIDSSLYVIATSFVIIGLFILCENILSTNITILDMQILSDYKIHSLAIICSYTLSYAIVINLTFKLLTDDLSYKSNPLLIILSSAIFTALFMTLSNCVVMNPFNIVIALFIFFSAFIITLIISYSYNQTRSIITSILSITLALLVIIII